MYLSSTTSEINNDIISKFIIKNRNNSNNFTTLIITISYDKNLPAKINLTSEKYDNNFERKIGNSRNERFNSDIDKILIAISDALKTNNLMKLIYEYIKKIFTYYTYMIYRQKKEYNQVF